MFEDILGSVVPSAFALFDPFGLGGEVAGASSNLAIGGSSSNLVFFVKFQST
jgi:hypothetical protein